MTLLTVTSFTWMVTGLGFGLVLLLLFIFVYVMKLLGMIMQPHKKQDGAAQAVTVSEPAAKADTDDQAAIAYALHLYYNSLHDIEPVNVTLHPHTTSWNSKSFGINNLHF